MNEKPLLDALHALGPAYVPRTRHLDPDGRPRFTNRLILEPGPYLRQHAHNPVDWRPYGDAAFAEAVARGVPVFLSVGYSTCHWCHVMEHESFEDEEIAGYLNAHFVPVKLDREERPDVDAVYMEVLQAMNGGGGGWPMSVFLTPDGAPLFAGTYFPPRDGARGHRPGFLSLMRAIERQWRDPRFAAQGHALLAELSRRSALPPGDALPGVEVLAESAATYRRTFDPDWGGFGHAPKFPRPAVLDHLLREARRAPEVTGPLSLEVVNTTLEKMALGGIYDHVAGGFARYSTDHRWLVPHFEKMLYDNAQLARTYTEAWQTGGRRHFADVAQDVLAWLDREMSAIGGGFYSATDADSEGEEGRFFLWTPEQIHAALPPDDARWVCETFDVTRDGNFEDANILNLREPLDAAASARWSRLRVVLREVRARRVPPGTDDKVLTAWNGLTISAFARAGVAFDRPELVERAARAAAFVSSRLADPAHPGRLLRAHCGGVSRHAGVLEDYAAMIGASLDLLEATGDARWLDAALAWQATQDALFADAADGGYFRSSHDAPPLPLREKPEYDGAEPSGNALAAENLLRLAEITGDAVYRAAGERTIRALDRLCRKAPTTLPRMLCALDFALAPVKQIVLVGTPAQVAPFRAALRTRFLPDAIVLAAASGDPLTDLPLFEGRMSPGVGGVAHVCVQGRCALPANTPEELLARL